MTDERIVLVTGATDGIGLQTASELARQGARVVVHGRSEATVDKARRKIEEAGGRTEGATFELASLASVRQGLAIPTVPGLPSLLPRRAWGASGLQLLLRALGDKGAHVRLVP
jgi:uncharacterized protein YbjT (DUF2867 family)